MTPKELYDLGHAYYYGNGVERDQAKGVKLIREAAAKGHEGAIRFVECHSNPDNHA